MTTPVFSQFDLAPPILRAIEEEGYTTPTTIQAAALPPALEGRDVLGTAQTGTGKTAAFALPILQRLATGGSKAPTRGGRPIRALILTPTRELALQVEESFIAYGRHLALRMAVLMGGVSPAPQVAALRRGPDILVSTPGRLLDLMNQGLVRLDRVETFVLDEADRMLDMGFVRDVQKVVAALPTKRQTLFFSATMSGEVSTLANSLLRDPVRVESRPEASVSTAITQQVLFVDRADKSQLLINLLQEGNVQRALVFTRTKHQANRLTQRLLKDGITAEVIHSNKSQNARQRALDAFDRGLARVLVGTDVVARGIDVKDISHVINFEMPQDADSYIHRIGRTARAGAVGMALSFCDVEEVEMLWDIERLTREPLTIAEHSFHSDTVAATHRRELRPPRKVAPVRQQRRFSPRREGGRRTVTR